MSGQPGLSESQKFRESGLTGYPDPTVEKIRRLVQKFGHTALIVNRLDYYGNGIPVGAFCNALCFILYGFYRCEVYYTFDTFLLSILLFFGGIGQATAGFLEFIKGRAFTSSIYLTLGFYCLSHYVVEITKYKYNSSFASLFTYDDNSLCAFYGAWMIITIPLVVASIKTNVMYVVQSGATFLFFFFMCVGEGVSKDGLRRITAGIFEVIAGFISLYLFASQLINEQLGRPLLTSIPLTDDNEIDIPPENLVETPQ